MKRGVKIALYTVGVLLGILFIFSFFIKTILSNTYEIHQHNIGVEGNRVFVADDGREAVFDVYGEPVDDIVNNASYNYRDPVNDPIGHFTLDTLPWILLGNAENDSSTKMVRLGAFLKDFRDGIKRTMSK